MTCQFSADGGYSWRAFAVDLSAGWCQGSLLEIEPNVLLWTYGVGSDRFRTSFGCGFTFALAVCLQGWGPGAGAGKELHSQLMKVTATGLEPIRYNSTNPNV